MSAELIIAIIGAAATIVAAAFPFYQWWMGRPKLATTLEVVVEYFAFVIPKTSRLAMGVKKQEEFGPFDGLAKLSIWNKGNSAIEDVAISLGYERPIYAEVRESDELIRSTQESIVRVGHVFPNSPIVVLIWTKVDVGSIIDRFPPGNVTVTAKSFDQVIILPHLRPYLSSTYYLTPINLQPPKTGFITNYRDVIIGAGGVCALILLVAGARRLFGF